MPRPKAPYRLKDGTEVPGVTTVLNRFKDSGGLTHWAWEQGKRGMDYRDLRDQAANVGTLTHALVEAHIRDLPLAPVLQDVPDDILKLAIQGYENFVRWKDSSLTKIIPLEQPLVSETYGFGGTPDAIFELDGHRSIGDWKTSNSVYVEHLCQLAAYGILCEENGLDAITDGFHLCRFSKENGDFTHYHFHDLTDAGSMFLRLLEAYQLDRVLKKRLG